MTETNADDDVPTFENDDVKHDQNVPVLPPDDATDKVTSGPYEPATTCSSTLPP